MTVKQWKNYLLHAILYIFLILILWWNMKRTCFMMRWWLVSACLLIVILCRTTAYIILVSVSLLLLSSSLNFTSRMKLNLNLHVKSLQFCISVWPVFVWQSFLLFPCFSNITPVHSCISWKRCQVWFAWFGWEGYSLASHEQEEETHMNHLRMIYEVNLSILVFR